MTGHPRYAIIGTESRLLQSRFVDQEFQISVALPVFHGRGAEKKCPVIYLLDANFYFGLVTEMTRIMAQCFEFPDTVAVIDLKDATLTVARRKALVNVGWLR